MQRKSTLTDDGDWDPKDQEPWYFEFKKKPVNDEKWTCIVTAAVESEAQDEHHIRTYAESVSTGLRKSIKIISMSDLTKLLKGQNNSRNSLGKPKTDKTTSLSRKSHPSRFSRVLDLAMKNATFTDCECKLPPDLMAVVLKFMIIKLKEENCLQKRTDATKERKTREQNIKSKFIRDLKPFEIRRETISSSKILETLLEVEEPVNDAPIDGPDLYILLTDFHNVFYFSELQAANVPFVAVLKISTQRLLGQPFHTSESELELANRRESVGIFWEKLNALENTHTLKNIAIMEYQAPSKDEDPSLDSRVLFDELTWMQYSAYRVLTQHEKYLKELNVQRLVLSLEPLDLSKCGVYNKLCDALVTGGPLTPLLVLHAMVEQVVAGVPDTDSSFLEYSAKKSDFFTASHGSGKALVEKVVLQTPCMECRHKKFVDVCGQLKDGQVECATQKSKPCEDLEEDSVNILLLQGERVRTSDVLTEDSGDAAELSETMISHIASERRTEREVREDKIWKAPRVCFYGDSVSFQSLHCDPRLFNSKNAVERFLRNATLFEIWKKYPELPPEERAFCNFHFYSLWKASNQTVEQLRLKILFTLSMKLIGIAESRQDPEVFEQEPENPARFSQNFRWMEEENRNFQNYFFKTFIVDRYFRVKKRTDFQDHVELSGQNVDRNFLSPYRNSEACLPKCFRQFENQPGNSSGGPHDRGLMTFYYLLDCFEISNLTEARFLENIKNHEDVIKRYKYYEFLESKLMIQRLLEAQEVFNTVQTSYYAPTDTIIMVMHNDSDYRGVFSTYESQALATPVTLRDFYTYVYPEIGKWLIDENAEHEKFVSELAEKIKKKEEEKDAKYLSLLKQEYCKMDEEQRKEFLENKDTQEPEVNEKELADLPLRPKPLLPDKVSFLTTNFTDIRVENNKKIIEYNSRDGTQVRLTFDRWLYTPSELLKLRIKRSRFLLHYHQWLNRDAINQDFLFRTTNDVILSFRKDTDKENSFNYNVTVSWPIGLLVRPVLRNAGLYIKQTYLKPYRIGWDIEGENSRCFLISGQVVILKEGGDYDVLFGSGTKITFHDSATTPKFEIVTTTGKIWQIPTKGPCKNRRKLISTNKVLVGVDPKTGETFHKREDGVTCMLWPNGTLVTTYPDGTKITTTPYFGEETTIEWTEEEKQYLSDLLMQLKMQQLVPEPKNRTILRNSTSPKTTHRLSIDPEPFLSVSCSYLIEHPKYSRIYFDPRQPYVEATMPENLKLLIYPEGNYEVHQGENFLTVKGEVVEFNEICDNCKSQSSVQVKLDWSEVLCRCVDFFEKAFFVYRDGRTMFQECYKEHEGGFESAGKTKQPCERGHAINESLKQRCFAFRRDLSGVEFLQEDSLALTLSQIPEETYFDLDSDDPDNIIHTFNIPFYKIGYENWEMDYLDKNDSMPTNLKKKDLKELGVKQTPKNVFKYPFPKHHNCVLQKSSGKKIPEEPKVIVTRTVRCLSQSPESVFVELQKSVTAYQKKARTIFQAYLNHKSVDGRTDDSRYIAMRLRKIAMTLNQSLHMYPHLCTNFPSTEKDIHYFGHFINAGELLRAHGREAFDILPKCSQIPPHFPMSSEFSCIYEESESPRDT